MNRILETLREFSGNEIVLADYVRQGRRRADIPYALFPDGSDSLLTKLHQHGVGHEVPRLDPGIQGERCTQDKDQGTELEKYGLVPSEGRTSGRKKLGFAFWPK